MTLSFRSIVTGVINTVTIFAVVGVIAHGVVQQQHSRNVIAVLPSVGVPKETDFSVPVIESAIRQLGKGKGKGKGSSLDCIPLGTTPEPTKGKGSKGSKGSKGKGSSPAPVSSFGNSFP